MNAFGLAVFVGYFSSGAKGNTPEAIAQRLPQLWENQIFQGQWVIVVLVVCSPAFVDCTRGKSLELFAALEEGGHVIDEAIALSVRQQTLNRDGSLLVILCLLLLGQSRHLLIS